MNMTKKFKVSVIVPVFNCEKYVSEAVESVTAQTFGFSGIQLILVDNGSSDGSAELCRSYSLRYPENILFLRQPKRGVSAARNMGLDNAAGDYACFLDGDDKYAADFIEKCVNFLDVHGEGTDFVLTPMRFFEASDQIYYLSERLKITCVVHLDKNPDIFTLSCCCGMFVGEAVRNRRFDEDKNIGEDLDFVNRLLLEKMKIGVAAETRYFYRKRSDKSSAIDNALSKPEYYNRIGDLYRRLFEYAIGKTGGVPEYIQHVVLNELMWYEIKTVPPETAGGVDFASLSGDLKYLARHIGDDIIIKQAYMNYALKIYFLQLKYNRPSGYLQRLISEQNGFSLTVQDIDERGGKIFIKGFCYLPDNKNIKPAVLVNGEWFDCAETFSLAERKYYLGVCVMRATEFAVGFPTPESGYISFYIREGSENVYKINIEFANQCRLTDDGRSFAAFETSIISKAGKTGMPEVRKLSQPVLRYKSCEAFSGSARDGLESAQKYLRNFKKKERAIMNRNYYEEVINGQNMDILRLTDELNAEKSLNSAIFTELSEFRGTAYKLHKENSELKQKLSLREEQFEAARVHTAEEHGNLMQRIAGLEAHITAMESSLSFRIGRSAKKIRKNPLKIFLLPVWIIAGTVKYIKRKSSKSF